MPLPSGFILSKEQHQVKEFKLPEEAKPILGEAKVAALEILDGLLFQKLGVHIFEPKVKLEETPVVKLAMQKPSSSTSILSTPTGTKALTGGQASKQRARNMSENKSGAYSNATIAK